MKLDMKLRLAKSTKGTHVYEMLDGQGRSIGNLYLPKLVMPAGDPPRDLSMTIGDEKKGK